MIASDLPFIDILKPDFDFNSAPVHEARQINWIARTPIGYAVLRYEDVSAMLKDERFHQGSVAILAMRGVTDGAARSSGGKVGRAQR